jgi:hypothetical protein
MVEGGNGQKAALGRSGGRDRAGDNDKVSAGHGRGAPVDSRPERLAPAP